VSAVAPGAPTPFVERSWPDVVARRLLFVPEVRPTARATDSAQRLFSSAMLISATRCLLGYVIFPILAPALGAAAGFTPIVGIPLGLVALFFDVKGMRRFFVADHKWRWPISAIYLGVMVLVVILLVHDLSHLA
jgi:hypothetical protein